MNRYRFTNKEPLEKPDLMAGQVWSHIKHGKEVRFMLGLKRDPRESLHPEHQFWEAIIISGGKFDDNLSEKYILNHCKRIS